MPHQPRTPRIALHVATHRQQVVILLDRERLEPPLLQWSGAGRVVAGMPALRMRPRQPAEEFGEVAVAIGPQH